MTLGDKNKLESKEARMQALFFVYQIIETHLWRKISRKSPGTDLEKKKERVTEGIYFSRKTCYEL